MLRLRRFQESSHDQADYGKLVGRSHRRRRWRVHGVVAATFAAMVVPLTALAGAGGPRYPITDEIQVYTDEINAPREWGLEVHVNTTPSGATQPAYPGAVPPDHGWRITPELSYGLSPDFELGLYLPTTTDAQNDAYYFGGVKLRLKWIALRPPEAGSGWFAGANLEVSDLNKSFSESRYSTELRLIGGYRSGAWLFSVNPILDWALSRGYRGGGPDVTFAVKASYEVLPGIAVGPEYYDTVGQTGNIAPPSERDRILFLAVDVARGPVPFNFGVGRGLDPSSDRWTLKAILEMPWP